VPAFAAVATRGEGVVETFRELLRGLYGSMEERHRFGEKFGVSQEAFLKGVLSNLASDPAAFAATTGPCGRGRASRADSA